MRRVASLVVVAATALLFALVAPRLRFTTAITHFLPDESDPRGAQIAALLADGETTRIMILDLQAEDPREAATALLGYLRARPEVASAQSGVTDSDARAILEFLASFPGSTFVPASAQNETELRARLEALRDELGSPASMLIRPIAPRDPLGGVTTTLALLRQARSQGLRDDDGVLVSADGQHAFVFAETRASPFDTDAQRAFKGVLEDWARGRPMTLQIAGAAQIAIASEAQIKGDVSRIGIISTVGTIALFLLLFGSPRLIALGLLPMTFGSAVAVLVCHAVFGAIHGITIAFGTSLLGLGIDYVEHFYTHLALDPKTEPSVTMRSVGPGIALGALTTIIGFVGIAASGVAGLREMALFSVVAIAASLVATYLFVPAWVPRRYRPPRTLARLDGVAHRLLARMKPPTRAQKTVALALAVLLVGAGLLAARFSDNVSLLVNDQGPALQAEREVRARLGDEDSVYAVVHGKDEDSLLQNLARVAAELRKAGVSFVALDALLPSATEQRARRQAALAAAPTLKKLMVELDFVPDQFELYFGSLATDAPVTLAAFRSSPLATFFAFWAPKENTILVPLGSAPDPAAVPSGDIVVPRQTVVDLFRGVRLRTLIASGLGLVAIFALLAVRYRSGRRALAALVPAILGCVATVLVLAAAGRPLTILHVMALLLVVSLGVDFGIFFVEKADSLEGAARTLVSILTASLSTVLSFGLLSVSENPGLAALGISLTLGTVFGLLSCLLVAWWLGAERMVA